MPKAASSTPGTNLDFEHIRLAIPDRAIRSRTRSANSDPVRAERLVPGHKGFLW